MEYLGFYGDTFRIREAGRIYVEASDSADQVIVSSGKDLTELKKNFERDVDKFYDGIEKCK